jgi:membrane protein YdbS with pleckstrin-like domain
MTSPDSDLPPQTSPLAEDRPHKPADDREEVYFQGSPMIRGELGKLITCTVLGLVLIAIPFVYRFLQHDKHMPVWWVTLACIVIGILIMTIPWFATKFVRYRISNYRIDFERGLLSKDIDTLELWHVEDINFHQSLLDRMLGVGTITVISHDDTTPRLHLRSLPKARPLFDQLKQRVIAVKRQRGVIKMDVGA